MKRFSVILISLALAALMAASSIELTVTRLAG